MILHSDFMEALDTVRNEWGDEVVVYACMAQKTKINFKDFLDLCTACGGNWGGMLLSGVRRLYPDVWDAIPEDMGVHAWGTICSLLIILGVDTSEEE